jgi:acyl-CoA synthetase (AMP-forming)/AMP-acid ligase II
MVHPAASFDAKSTLMAIALEGANVFPSVPAMNVALLNHQDFEKKGTIDHIIIGTTTVSPEFLRKTATDFGAKRTSDGYGLTETGAIWFHMPGTDPKETYPCPELMMRVCDPETDEVLSRGVPGELHCGGTGVVSHYLLSKKQGEDPKRAFYDDKLGHWMRTGDQVVMAENGEVRVIGRYKDLIKRGGENLSPRLIEIVLAEDCSRRSCWRGASRNREGKGWSNARSVSCSGQAYRKAWSFVCSRGHNTCGMYWA